MFYIKVLGTQKSQFQIFDRGICISNMCCKIWDTALRLEQLRLVGTEIPVKTVQSVQTDGLCLHLLLH